MTIPPIEYLTAENVRRLSDPKVMGLNAYRHPYFDDAYVATDVAAPLAQMPSHWKASPLCRAFSLLFEIDRTETLRRGDVVEGRRVEARRDPAEVTGMDKGMKPQGDWYKLDARFDQRERGPGIVHVRGIEPRPVATVGYDDMTGDDVAADWRRS